MYADGFQNVSCLCSTQRSYLNICCRIKQVDPASWNKCLCYTHIYSPVLINKVCFTAYNEGKLLLPLCFALVDSIRFDRFSTWQPVCHLRLLILLLHLPGEILWDSVQQRRRTRRWQNIKLPAREVEGGEPEWEREELPHLLPGQRSEAVTVQIDDNMLHTKTPLVAEIFAHWFKVQV